MQNKVLENIEIAEGVYKLTLESEEVAKKSVPGQFVSIKCGDLTLRRPFSVAKVNGTTYEIIYKIKGTGTEFMAELKPSDTADVFGPLGSGYTIEDKNYLLIGCGVGIAPIEFLMGELDKKDIKYNVIGCFRSKYSSCSEYDYLICEDGSSDIKGRLDQHFEKIVQKTKPDIICMCGPNPAMEYVTNYALEHNIDIEVALEGDMACGTGVCMGCAIKIKNNGQLESAKICKDGPVFKGKQIVWG